jgi:hypothetical protein
MYSIFYGTWKLGISCVPALLAEVNFPHNISLFKSVAFFKHVHADFDHAPCIYLLINRLFSLVICDDSFLIPPH